MKPLFILPAAPRAPRPASRTASAVIITAASALLLAACSGSPSSGGSANTGGSTNAGGSQSSQLLAFSHCMRSHGVSNFPDAVGADKFPGAQQLKVSDTQYQAALNNCRHLLPNSGNSPDQAQLQQQQAGLLPFSRCMRSHGIPNWPDPTISTNSRGNTGVVFNVLGRQGLDRGGIDSPRVLAAEHQCKQLLPSNFDHFRFEEN